MVISQRRIIHILETIWFLSIGFYLVIIVIVVVRTLANVSSKKKDLKTLWSLWSN